MVWKEVYIPMALSQNRVKLHNGITVPLYGLDTIGFSEEELPSLIRQAINNGITHIETSAEYNTEAAIGEAIRESGIPRKDLFLTDEIKGINNTEATVRSANASLRRLGVDYVDLLLLAWNGGDNETDPQNKRVHVAWKGLEKLYKTGYAHAIGIVDFYPWQVEYLLNDVEIAPMVCYAGLYPGHPDLEKLVTYAEHNILTMSYLPQNIDLVLASKELKILAEKHQCTPRDIVLQYLKQKNCVITLRRPVLPSEGISLTEEEMIFLDMMKDYTA